MLLSLMGAGFIMCERKKRVCPNPGKGGDKGMTTIVNCTTCDAYPSPICVSRKIHHDIETQVPHHL